MPTFAPRRLFEFRSDGPSSARRHNLYGNEETFFVSGQRASSRTNISRSMSAPNATAIRLKRHNLHEAISQSTHFLHPVSEEDDFYSPNGPGQEAMRAARLPIMTESCVAAWEVLQVAYMTVCSLSYPPLEKSLVSASIKRPHRVFMASRPALKWNQ